MGDQLSILYTTKMKAFMIATLVGMAAAAPAILSRGSHVAHAAHPFALAVHAAPFIGHPVAHAAAAFAHPAAAYASAPVAAYKPAPAYAPAPVISPPAPAYAPAAVIAHHAPAPVYKETPEPYTYTYAVVDDYSKVNFNAAETSDANGVGSGSYQVALPDGRTQTVKYTADHVNGYVAEVSYEGVPVYPEAKPYVPAPAYHA